MARRIDISELLQLTVLSFALAVYVYAIGWALTWVRLAAANLPVAATLPQIDGQVVFATGVRAMLVMAIVFAAMCIVAYAVYVRRWDDHAAEWTEIVETDRLTAHERFLESRPSKAAPRPRSAWPRVKVKPTAQERIVRVIAGFNVGVLAAAIGLVGGRFLRTLIDDWQPGHWWALLAPWALCTVIAALALTRANPAKGGRFMHGLLWLFVIGVAIFSSAPVGLLMLTWAGIGTFGRWYGSRPLPGSVSEFLRSPLPWLLLSVYALVALAYSAMPPVSFPQVVVRTTTDGEVIGGYLARTSSGVYLASCTPLADATSAAGKVRFVPAAAIESVSADSTEFTLDNGSRPSLPTLLLSTLGIEAHTSTWLRPELRETRAPCAGLPAPRPRGGIEDPRLGVSVFAGAPQPNGSAQDGEAPIGQTTPQLAALARRFQPTVLVSIADPFWPVSVNAALHGLGAGGRGTCVYRKSRGCVTEHPTAADLAPPGSADDYLRFPSKKALPWFPPEQLEAFLRGQRGLGSPIPSRREWLTSPGILDPWASAQVYFFYAGRTEPAHWPAHPAVGQEIEPGLVGLQYWFFYPYNYYPTVVKRSLMADAPIAADVVNTDLHQGDWEHVTVLVNPRTGRPRWLYTARHSNEGEYLPWNSPRLTFDEGHPVVQAAIGGHPTYPAGCGPRLRYANGLKGLASDWLVCGPGRFAFRASSTPLVDIARTPWACWKGHFGFAPHGIAPASTNESQVQLLKDKYFEVAGPRSPLWQAENGHLLAAGEPGADSGVCLRDPRALERQAVREGIGG